MTKFALLIALALACGEAGALKCYICNSVTSSKAECEDGPDSKYLLECPPSPVTGTRTTQCTKLDGVVTTNEDMDSSFERGCTYYLTSDLPEEKCYTDKDAESWILEAADPSIRPLLNGTFTFKGNLCFCNTDQCNGVASVQPFLGLLVAALGLYVMGVWR